MIRLTTIPLERLRDVFVADYRKARFVLLTSLAARLEMRCRHFGNGDEREIEMLEIQAPVDTEHQRCRVRGLINALISERLLQAVEIHYETTGEYDWLAGFFETQHLEMPSNIFPSSGTLSDLQFFRDRVSLAIEQDRLDKSLENPPFDGFTERTVRTATAGDVTAAMRNISDEVEAHRFITGYVEDMVSEGIFDYHAASEAVLENLRLGAGKSFSDEDERLLLEVWSKVLSSH